MVMASDSQGRTNLANHLGSTVRAIANHPRGLRSDWEGLVSISSGRIPELRFSNCSTVVNTNRTTSGTRGCETRFGERESLACDRLKRYPCGEDILGRLMTRDSASRSLRTRARRRRSRRAVGIFIPLWRLDSRCSTSSRSHLLFVYILCWHCAPRRSLPNTHFGSFARLCFHAQPQTSSSYQ